MSTRTCLHQVPTHSAFCVRLLIGFSRSRFAAALALTWHLLPGLCVSSTAAALSVWSNANANQARHYTMLIIVVIRVLLLPALPLPFTLMITLLLTNYLQSYFLAGSPLFFSSFFSSSPFLSSLSSASLPWFPLILVCLFCTRIYILILGQAIIWPAMPVMTAVELAASYCNWLCQAGRPSHSLNSWQLDLRWIDSLAACAPLPLFTESLSLKGILASLSVIDVFAYICISAPAGCGSPCQQQQQYAG